MGDKVRVCVLFGGRSCEHEVSVTSARAVLDAIDKDKYEVTMIGVTKEGRWLAPADAAPLLQAGVVEEGQWPAAVLDYSGTRSLAVQGAGSPGQQVDVVLPILHGPFGEDGTVQGFLELAGVPYVGSGVLGSAVGMDKEMMKRIFRDEGLAQVDFDAVRRPRWDRQPEAVLDQIEAKFAYPLFIKPANLGSSVGVSKAFDRDGLVRAIDQGFRFDSKIIVEAEARDCREVECAVLGNDEPQASVVGEVVPCNEFYDYEAKYVADDSELHIPARIAPETGERVRQLAVQAFQAVEAAGLARVDFFVDKASEAVSINEINTIPGFTPISMYPKLWAASGISYGELIDRLIQLALERHAQRQHVRTSL
ncbi:MAG: D-alanine--D-alanine ligase [Candidatus Latescibacteria bacterium]|nr:D-alanine--D-alanine ligase [Candidatus Latescibacterota bacterium]